MSFFFNKKKLYGDFASVHDACVVAVKNKLSSGTIKSKF